MTSFAEHRSVEIQAMAELVKDTGGNHIAFQKLPRHMRRRAMSHNIKRIPRRLHAVAKLEVKVFIVYHFIICNICLFAFANNFILLNWKLNFYHLCFTLMFLTTLFILLFQLIIFFHGNKTI